MYQNKFNISNWKPLRYMTLLVCGITGIGAAMATHCLVHLSTVLIRRSLVKLHYVGTAESEFWTLIEMEYRKQNENIFSRDGTDFCHYNSAKRLKFVMNLSSSSGVSKWGPRNLKLITIRLKYQELVKRNTQVSGFSGRNPRIKQTTSGWILWVTCRTYDSLELFVNKLEPPALIKLVNSKT